MRRRGNAPAGIAALLLALALAACGGGDGSSTGETEAGDTTQAAKGGSNGGEGGAKGSGSGSGSREGDSGGSGGDADDFVPRRHEDSGGGSEQFEAPQGGDNSVQEYGREADPAEFDAAAVVLHNFLDARAQGNWAAACTFMAANVVRSFQQLAERSGKVKGASCGEIVASIVSPKAQDDLKVEAAKADIGSVRVEGDRALVMYTTTGGTVVAIPMKNEGGAWKVGSLAGIPLN